MVLLLPRRSKDFSSKILSSLVCRVRLISPISSRKSVPSFACSNLPILSLSAPVKAPRSWPKSSLSSRFSGILEQLIFTKGLFRRWLLKWTVPARRLFPVPVSPVIRMVESVSENFRKVLIRSCMAGVKAMILSKLYMMSCRCLK